MSRNQVRADTRRRAEQSASEWQRSSRVGNACCHPSRNRETSNATQCRSHTSSLPPPLLHSSASIVRRSNRSKVAALLAVYYFEADLIFKQSELRGPREPPVVRFRVCLSSHGCLHPSLPCSPPPPDTFSLSLFLSGCLLRSRQAHDYIAT